MVSHGADDHSAWVTGAFRGSEDAPDCQDLWPADYALQVTYRLGTETLRVEAAVHNPDTRPLPFGLGYHPYFRLPFNPAARPEDCCASALATISSSPSTRAVADVAGAAAGAASGVALVNLLRMVETA